MFTGMRYFVAYLFFLASAFAQSSQPCRVTFSVVRKDSVGNLLTGFRPETKEWFQKKMAKKFPDVCYSEGDTDTVLFFSATPAVFHGVHEYSTSNTTSAPTQGTITDTTPGSPTYGQQIGTTEGTVQTTTTTEHQVPYEVDYDRLHLTIEVKIVDKWKSVESFDGRTLHPTFYGVCTRNCHPNHSMIEEAVKYLHNMK